MRDGIETTHVVDSVEWTGVGQPGQRRPMQQYPPGYFDLVWGSPPGSVVLTTRAVSAGSRPCVCALQVVHQIGSPMSHTAMSNAVRAACASPTPAPPPPRPPLFAAIVPPALAAPRQTDGSSHAPAPPQSQVRQRASLRETTGQTGWGLGLRPYLTPPQAEANPDLDMEGNYGERKVCIEQARKMYY